MSPRAQWLRAVAMFGIVAFVTMFPTVTLGREPHHAVIGSFAIGDEDLSVRGNGDPTRAVEAVGAFSGHSRRA